MTDPVISVSALSKCYRLGTIGRHTLMDESRYWWHRLRGRDPAQLMARIGQPSDRPVGAPGKEHGNGLFWALREVSFDIREGEVIGVIGRNGAGKSTLLRLLTRITEPTSGEAVIRGRVASMLEVGTGFHPELTGRENVYMNGTILGMKRREIDRKMDEIVAFSEIERFIDTPVKRYSSGMYVRLAFAVTAHLESEILLLDEVLAVGDSAFQKKCMNKMLETARSGRTLLFVSHNLHAVRSLCPRSILLVDGRAHGPMATDDALHQYVGLGGEETAALWRAANPKGVASVWITQHDKLSALLNLSEPFEISLRLTDALVDQPTHVGVEISNEQGDVIYHSADLFNGREAADWRTGHRVVAVPAHALFAGRYRLSFQIWHRERGLIEQVVQALSWAVTLDHPVFTTYPPSVWRGMTGPGMLEWSCRASLELPATAGQAGVS